MDRKINNGMLHHPNNAPQWKKIVRLYPEFGEEARNLRLGLSIDGMNPHSLQSSSHSTWPVLLVNYNLPHPRPLVHEAKVCDVDNVDL